MTGYLWNKIKQEYHGNDKNAFVLGASKETMSGIVNRGPSGWHYREKVVRAELDQAVSEGLMVRGTNPKTNYTTYIMSEEDEMKLNTNEAAAKKIKDIMGNLKTYRTNISEFRDDIKDSLVDINDTLGNISGLETLQKSLEPEGKLFTAMAVGEKGIILTEGRYKGHVVVRLSDSLQWIN